MQKVIFLDIDGVLNSVAYDRVRGAEEGNIDVSRLPLVCRIVEGTGAKIVLSSSWRKHWDPEVSKRDPIGEELNRTFLSAGLQIYGKTPILHDRCEEITVWLARHPEVKRYVIIDDIFAGWGEHASHLVRTNNRIGRGLEEHHVHAAIAILNAECDDNA